MKETNLGCGRHSDAGVLKQDALHSNVLRIWAEGNGGCHTNTGMRQQLNADVPADAVVVVKADVKSVNSSVRSGCGLGSEMPVMLELKYLTDQGLERVITWTFTHKVGGTCEDRVGRWHADQKAFQVNTTVPHDQWFDFSSGNARALDSSMARIIGLSVLGRGWDYDGRVDNLQLVVATSS